MEHEPIKYPGQEDVEDGEVKKGLGKQQYLW